MSSPLGELLPTKPEVRLRLYAWSTPDLPKYAGCLKIGQTTRAVATRVRESQGQATYDTVIEVEELGERYDGSIIRDHDLRARLREKGFESVDGEWMRCTAADVRTALGELRRGQTYSGTHHETFTMRPEQEAAVDKTVSYFRSVWAEDPHAEPRFLWNAKMRFGKTFATYQLARRLEARKILVITFKPAVEDAWRTDLLTHVDFDGWEYVSALSKAEPQTANRKAPLVCFGSFQDLLGRDKSGNLKAKNAWLHSTNWDLIVFDEYHFGAWRETAQELFEGEERSEAKAELAAQAGLDEMREALVELGEQETDFLPITANAYLYLSGTPFKALASGEFIEEQIFNWTYTDEQRAKHNFAQDHPDEKNPYGALPEMRLFTYQMPDELVAVAAQGEFDEFDLNEFFAAAGRGDKASFAHADEVQKWLNIIRGQDLPSQLDAQRDSTRPPFPYSDVRLLPYLQHSVWFLPNVAACYAMANLLRAPYNTFWRGYEVLVVAGTAAGIGVAALPPVRKALGSGHDTKTITLTCGKLTTGVTVPQWSSILMLRNLTSPETYFQAAFRVQSPWSISNPNGDDPHEEEILKPACFVFDFAPTRALRQVAEYGAGLSPEESNSEHAVADLVRFLPVLAYDGSNMTQIDAGGILDMALAGTSATLLARKWESAILVNVDNDTLRRIINNPDALDAVMRIEGFRALGDNVIETVINKSEAVKTARREQGENLTPEHKRQLSDEEKEYKSKRKQIQEKLIKFATRLPAFMYLTDFRENTLQDVINKLERDLFETVTGLSVDDFNLLVSLGVFNATQMNQAIFAFRRYEDSSLAYTGIESHQGLPRVGLYDTVVAVEQLGR